eukprot:CAMPEP_0194545490 /NCGR_PEP_ID=MMETSP0253-20130528/89271_1 /TAXON_ID=2966 /ORGANISM="Noctiluca scintillans" /LENGTH=153 /DNA_ID=CAMNT_0039392489 /DNA_START=45 /DNA_END=506 /DNA_ORIENTATION=-
MASCWIPCGLPFQRRRSMAEGCDSSSSSDTSADVLQVKPPEPGKMLTVTRKLAKFFPRRRCRDSKAESSVPAPPRHVEEPPRPVVPIDDMTNMPWDVYVAMSQLAVEAKNRSRHVQQWRRLWGQETESVDSDFDGEWHLVRHDVNTASRQNLA